MNNPLDFLISFYRQFDEGKIFLSSGLHAHKITTKGTPTNVWIGETNAGDIPVCGGDINMYGTTLTEDGFILYADIGSDSVELDWQASLEQ